jgi:signal transduction histidine kinase/DNA-binding response OmpR family regulator
VKPEPIRVLLLDDSEDDAALVLRALRRGGLEIDPVCVSDAEGFRAALAARTPDLILSDFNIPGFSGPAALATVRGKGLDVPFLIVSGAVGEAAAVETMRAGANDYLLKGELARLVPAVQRELRDVAVRRERRFAEDALRKSEAERAGEAALLRETETLAGVGSWEFETQSGKIRLTHGCWRILGAAPDSVPLTPEWLGALLDPDERARCAELLRRCLSGEPGEAELKLTTPDGRPVHVRALCSPVREWGTVVRLRGAVLDVTERRRLEAQILLADRLSAMGNMAAGVAHEINNPLTYLLGNLSSLQDDMAEKGGGPESIPHDLPQLLADCLEGAQRIQAIVRDLKSFSRVDHEQPGPSDARRAAGNVIRMLRGEALHRAQVVLEPGTTPVWAACSETRLAQLVTNLLLNALQAFPQRPMQQNQVHISVRDCGHDVEIAVADNGPGIPPALRDRIFEPFFTTKPAGVGTGLGLSVSRTIAAAAGGRIELDTEVGKGSTFRVVLPSALAPARAPETPGPLKALASSGGPRERLLVIDDDPNVLRMLQRSLATFDVEAAGSATEGLELLFGGSNFDLVLCDLMMPGMSGIELYEQAVRRSEGLARRFLFISGGATTPQVRGFVERLPPARILEKPFTPEALLQRVRTLLAR